MRFGKNRNKTFSHRSLDRLGLEYVDCFLIHWPGVSKTPPSSERNKTMRDESWRALVDLVRMPEGRCRSVGVSNYTLSHLQQMEVNQEAMLPMVNQIELHPACVVAQQQVCQ
eukprot:c5281_g1_i2.p1 GENE.c5281_g1_i2~~c5281_g1_i2.p1  ORF type:complete len:112 (-),score=23.93 c5281_g1_i2:426-761(-)